MIKVFDFSLLCLLRKKCSDSKNDESSVPMHFCSQSTKRQVSISTVNEYDHEMPQSYTVDQFATLGTVTKRQRMITATWHQEDNKSNATRPLGYKT